MSKTFSVQVVDGVEYEVLDAGARQAVVAEASEREAGDVIIDGKVNDLMAAVEAEDVSLSGYETRGVFINKYGELVSSAATYACSKPIPVSMGKKYVFAATATDLVAAICTCDAYAGSISVISVFTSSEKETFEYIPEKDGYIAISYDYAQPHMFISVDNTIGEVSEKRTNLIDLSKIRYGVNWTGGAAADRACVDVVAEPGKTYYLKATANNHLWGISIIEKNGILPDPINNFVVRTDTAGQTTFEKTFKTSDKTTLLIVQFAGRPDGYTLSSTDFDGYKIELYQFDSSSDTTAVDSVSRSVFAIKENIIDPAEIEIGKNWTGGSAADRAVVAVPILPNKPYMIDVPASPYWNSISLVQKKDKWNLQINNEMIATNQRYCFITKAEAYWLYVQINGNATITEEMLSGYDIYLCTGTNEYETADTPVRDSLLGWKNKKMVWLGTSIPAGGRDGLDNRHMYPNMVGDILHSIVFNEAVGSSALHCKTPSRINANNPYGFFANFEAVSRCLTNSLDEMDYIIEHYNDPNIFTQNVPETLTDADKEFIRSCSWEIKIEKYLEDGKFPDVWVIDHGHNDAPNAESEATYTARTNLTGTQHNGYYTNGSFVESSASSYIEFDVSNVEEVWLSATIGQYYDVYDLFDGSGNLLSYKANTSETTYTDLFIDTSSASKLRVSDPNNLVSTITVKKYTYGSMYNSLYSFQGGMDFLINKIKEYNPKARIVMIGEYEDQKFPNVSHYQKIVAERWEFPLYEQWKNLGWSQQLVKVDGVYKTYLEVFIPDNLHPHTDTTGLVNRMMAENIAAWMNGIRP